jgi:hypothetical protein
MSADFNPADEAFPPCVPVPDLDQQISNNSGGVVLIADQGYPRILRDPVQAFYAPRNTGATVDPADQGFPPPQDAGVQAEGFSAGCRAGLAATWKPPTVCAYCPSGSLSAQTLLPHHAEKKGGTYFVVSRRSPQDAHSKT